MKDLEELRDQLHRFADARDWDRFHSPKNLAMALSAEAGELLDPFLWLTEEQSRHLPAESCAAVEEELADVFLYTLRLADVLGIDLLQAGTVKIRKNGEKYPVDKARGNALKYTSWQPKPGGSR